jgi:hypothetical protein
MMPPTLERYTLVRSDGIHGLGTSALPPRIEPRRPRMERVCLRLLWCALRFFLLLCLRARLEPERLRLWCALRLALVRLPLMECLRLDLLVTGILRGIYSVRGDNNKNNILERCALLLHIDMCQHMATTAHFRESEFIENFTLGGLRGVFFG